MRQGVPDFAPCWIGFVAFWFPNSVSEMPYQVHFLYGVPVLGKQGLGEMDEGVEGAEVEEVVAVEDGDRLCVAGLFVSKFREAVALLGLTLFDRFEAGGRGRALRWRMPSL